MGRGLGFPGPAPGHWEPRDAVCRPLATWRHPIGRPARGNHPHPHPTLYPEHAQQHPPPCAAAQDRRGPADHSTAARQGYTEGGPSPDPSGPQYLGGIVEREGPLGPDGRRNPAGLGRQGQEGDPLQGPGGGAPGVRPLPLAPSDARSRACPRSAGPEWCYRKWQGWPDACWTCSR